MKIKTEQDRAQVFSLLLFRLNESGSSAIEFLGELDREHFLKD